MLGAAFTTGVKFGVGLLGVATPIALVIGGTYVVIAIVDKLTKP